MGIYINIYAYQLPHYFPTTIKAYEKGYNTPLMNTTWLEKFTVMFLKQLNKLSLMVSIKGPMNLSWIMLMC